MTPITLGKSNSNTAIRSFPTMSHSLRWGLVGIFGFVLLLEIAPRSGLIDERFLPPISEIGATLVRLLGTATFWGDLLQTLLGMMIGLAIAMTAGVAIGFLIGSSEYLREATHSTIEFLRPIPSVALIPLVVLIFGTDMKSTLVLVIYASFWPTLIQVLYGMRELEPVAIDTARSYHFSRRTYLLKLVWPTTLPYIMTGLRLSAMIALTLELTGELVIGTPGIGLSIAVAQVSGAVTNMYALIVVTGLIGIAINFIVRHAERKVLHWHPSIRREVAA